MPYKDPNKGRSARAAYYAQNKANMLERHRYVKYGLLPGIFDIMWEAQGGMCACCGDRLSAGRGTHVDHDHKTGVVRGLLCRRCNHMIGGARDNPDILTAGAQYLKDVA